MKRPPMSSPYLRSACSSMLTLAIIKPTPCARHIGKIIAHLEAEAFTSARPRCVR